MSVRLQACVASLFLAAPILAAPLAHGALAQEGKAPFEIRPITIDGHEISETEIQRALIYIVGTSMLEARKLDVLIEAEMRRQIAAGADPKSFVVEASEVQKTIDDAYAEIEKSYPDTPPEVVLQTNGLTPDMWRTQLEQAKLFDKVFLPDDPDKWPEVTREALLANNGPEFVVKIEEAFKRQHEAAQQEGAEPQNPQGKGMLQMILRQMIIGQLTRSAVVKLASDGLPHEVAMEVNGVKVMTADLWNALKSRVTEDDYRLTRLWLVKTTVVEKALRESGDWLSDEQWAEVFAAHNEPYEKSPINLQVLVVSFKRFPSLEAYKSYFRLMESYRRKIADELSDENLAGHLDRADDLMGLARLDAEAILLSAYDFGSGRWKEGGWAKAAERATEVVSALAAGGDWDQLLDENSEFWDPPSPQNPSMQQQQQQQAKLNRGRLGLANRNELVQKLGESEFTMFLNGSSVADYMFFDQEPGSVDGPFKGRFGYYITRVKGRTEPVKHLSLENPDDRRLVETDYLQVRFHRWAQDLMAEVEVHPAEL